jgi:hypothetical protein
MRIYGSAWTICFMFMQSNAVSSELTAHTTGWLDRKQDNTRNRQIGGFASPPIFG